MAGNGSSGRVRIIAVGILLVLASVASADEIRIATWNISYYSGGRVAELQTAIYGQYMGRSMAPDILVGQEFISAAAVTNFVSILNTAPGSPGDWAAAAFVDGPDTDSAFFYRTSRVALATDLSPNGVTVVSEGGVAPNHPRHIMRYDVRLSPGVSGESRLALYSTHMKAGSSSGDQARRLVEAQRIREDAESLPPGWHFLIGGDFNVQSSTQAAYQELVGSKENNDGRFFDPIKTPGAWNNNYAFRFVHTQDPIGAGGMDDRHDQILLSTSLIDNVAPYYLGDASVPYSTSTWDDPVHTYRSWGNDGTSFDTTLTITGNQMVGAVIAQALVDCAAGAGHLPVFLDLRIPPCVGDFDCDGNINLVDYAAFADCMTGPGQTPDPTPPTVPEQCLETFDFDDDEDVDAADFAAFQEILAAQ
jgi:hypothetical protein